jgi:hypothetical protein
LLRLVVGSGWEAVRPGRRSSRRPAPAWRYHQRVDCVAELDEPGPEYPAIKTRLVVEAVADVAQHVEILRAGVRVDGGDHAALPDGADADDGLAGGERPGQVGSASAATLPIFTRRRQSAADP